MLRIVYLYALYHFAAVFLSCDFYRETQRNGALSIGLVFGERFELLLYCCVTGKSTSCTTIHEALHV